MEHEPSFGTPFKHVKITWKPETGDRQSSLETCLGDVLLASVTKLIEMVRSLQRLVSEEGNEDSQRSCAALAKEVHQQEIVVTRCLLSPAVADKLTSDIIRFPYRLERIGDMLENILSCFERKRRDGIQFSAEARAELNLLFTALLDILDDLGKVFSSPDAARLEELIVQGKRLSQTLASYRQAHWERLWSGACVPQASSLYLDMLDSIKWTNEYLKKICTTLIESGTEE